MLEDTGIEIEHKSLTDKVLEYIKMMILSGRLKGGERIPESVIAKKFGASRTADTRGYQALEYPTA